MWHIVDGPGEGPWEGRDAVGWLWTLKNDAGDRWRVLVEVTGTAMATADEFLPEETREAKLTSGRSEVERVLQEEEPPERITLHTHGRSLTAEA
jgi:hypothetical protein